MLYPLDGLEEQRPWTNGPPYGNEYSFNGLRLADNLARHEGNEVKVFLIGDAAACAKRGQKVPHGFYNIELMLHPILRHHRGGECRVESTGLGKVGRTCELSAITSRATHR